MTIDKSMIKRLVTQTFPNGGDKYFDYEEEFDALCRAIEAAVLPEGWVAVPEVIGLYEKALKASWPNGATGDAFDYWNKARYLLAATTQLAPKNRGE